MLDLILLIILVWAFVRFYKNLTSWSRASNRQVNNPEAGKNSRSRFTRGNRKSFDDIEEAEYIEIKENDKESSGSH